MRHESKYAWAWANDTAVLLRDNEPVAEYTQVKSGQASFTLNDAIHTVRKDGFWSQRVLVERGGTTVATVRRAAFRNKAAVELNGRDYYSLKVSNGPLVKVTVLDANDEKLIVYKLKMDVTVRTVLRVHANNLPEHEQLLLMLVGYYCFRDAVLESQGHDGVQPY